MVGDRILSEKANGWSQASKRPEAAGINSSWARKDLKTGSFIPRSWDRSLLLPWVLTGRLQALKDHRLQDYLLIVAWT